MAGLVGSALGLVYSATAHWASGCATSGSAPVVHEGHEHKDSCAGGDGWDSLYGYGEDDQLYGGKERDEIRGATGHDELIDAAGTYDTDSVCDGAGGDLVDYKDGDWRDELYTTDGSFGLVADGPDEYETSVTSCPM